MCWCSDMHSQMHMLRLCCRSMGGGPVCGRHMGAAVARLLCTVTSLPNGLAVAITVLPAALNACGTQYVGQATQRHMFNRVSGACNSGGASCGPYLMSSSARLAHGPNLGHLQTLVSHMVLKEPKHTNHIFFCLCNKFLWHFKPVHVLEHSQESFLGVAGAAVALLTGHVHACRNPSTPAHKSECISSTVLSSIALVF